jgi:hypothetical protein
MDLSWSRIVRHVSPGAQKMADVREMALFSIMIVASAHLLWRYVWQVTEFFRLQVPEAGKGFGLEYFGSHRVAR